ncbi:MAG: Maf family protein [Candidatus Adiutrix sp.]|jgi:septum formation protein|nr:Maf family protein [Candidatus Adiutrix sp.]
MFADNPLILASASPRRADLLAFAGVHFEIAPSDIAECRRPDETPAAYVSRLAKEKAIARPHPGRPVLAADTIVFIGNDIFEKPEGPEEAARHLSALAGRSHWVATAFCLIGPDGLARAHDVVVSAVTFRQLTAREIEAYVAAGESLDKAGAYGLQGTGAFLVDSINGSLTSVIGLPLPEVLQALRAVENETRSPRL